MESIDQARVEGNPQSPILAQAEDFLEKYALAACRQHVKGARSILRRFLCQTHPECEVAAFRAAFQDYLTQLKLAGKAAGTIRNHAGIISVFCQYLVDDVQSLPMNPCSGIRLPKRERRLPVYLTRDEAKLALAAAERNACWPEVAFALATGLRLGELTRLEWSDLNVTERLVFIRNTKSHRDRAVPLSKLALSALAEQRPETGGFRWIFPGRHTFGAGSSTWTGPGQPTAG